MAGNVLRGLPSVDRVIADTRVRADVPSPLATALAREVLEGLRSDILSGMPPPPFDAVVDAVLERCHHELRLPLRPLINATGVIIHTNLGRVPLAAEAIEAMAEVASGYSDVEYDAESGKRGSRHNVLGPLICRITGAEAAMALNNNAGAVLLTLSALAAGKEVVLSRGQLVEIGGGFRVPEVMRQSRAKLIEVGTTNRTRAADYAAAIGPRTAALMRVHASNFKVVGFTEAASLDEIISIAKQNDLLVVDDVGSGCLLDTTRYGLAPEPTPQASIAAGADVVMFSGDKLLGGPQGGLIAGKRQVVDRLKKHPLARALRLDKASIAGLAATLVLYVAGRAEDRIPVWRMIALPLETIESRAQATAAAVGAATEVIPGRSMIGGGSLPEEGLETRLVALRHGRGAAPDRVAAGLRRRRVIPRIERGRVLLDLRTVQPEADEIVAAACREALAEAAVT